MQKEIQKNFFPTWSWWAYVLLVLAVMALLLLGWLLVEELVAYVQGLGEAKPPTSADHTAISTAIATLIASIVVIVSVGFIWYQVRENTRLTRAANTQHLVELSAPFKLQMFQDSETAKFWVENAEKWTGLDPTNKYRYRSLLTWHLIFYENIFYQNKAHLMDKNIYNAWDASLEQFIVEQHLDRSSWGELKSVFQLPFVEHMDQLVAKLEGKMGIGTVGLPPH